MARAVLAALLLLAGGAQAASPRQQTLRVSPAYYTSSEVTAFVPTTVAAGDKLPLVLMLGGYCMPAQIQDDLQLQYESLVNSHNFVYIPMKSARMTRTCALCSTAVRAADAAGNMPIYAVGARLTAAFTAMGFCTAWDATPACCITENAGKNGGDSAYIKDIITMAIASLPVDASRVYLVGIANGGFMAQQLACDDPSLFAGVLAYASGIDATQCTSTARVPLLLLQGDADVVVPFAGGYNSASITFPGFVATAASWLTRSGCNNTPVLGSFVAKGAGAGDDSYTVTTAEYTQGCDANARFAAWRIINGQHFALPGTSAVIFQRALGWLMGF